MKHLYINAVQRLIQCMMKVIFTVGRCVVLTQEALFVQAFKSWITEVPSWPFFQYVTKFSMLKDSFYSSSWACCAAVVCAEWCYWKPLSGAMSIDHSVSTLTLRPSFASASYDCVKSWSPYLYLHPDVQPRKIWYCLFACRFHAFRTIWLHLCCHY